VGTARLSDECALLELLDRLGHAVHLVVRQREVESRARLRVPRAARHRSVDRTGRRSLKRGPVGAKRGGGGGRGSEARNERGLAHLLGELCSVSDERCRRVGRALV